MLPGGLAAETLVHAALSFESLMHVQVCLDESCSFQWLAYIGVQQAALCHEGGSELFMHASSWGFFVLLAIEHG